MLASRARQGFTLYLDDKEKVIAQIERNDGKSLHALDLEVGAERIAQDDPHRRTGPEAVQQAAKGDGTIATPHDANSATDKSSELNKIAENVSVRELTRDFDIS